MNTHRDKNTIYPTSIQSCASELNELSKTHVSSERNASAPNTKTNTRIDNTFNVARTDTDVIMSLSHSHTERLNSQDELQHETTHTDNKNFLNLVREPSEFKAYVGHFLTTCNSLGGLNTLRRMEWEELEESIKTDTTVAQVMQSLSTHGKMRIDLDEGRVQEDESKFTVMGSDLYNHVRLTYETMPKTEDTRADRNARKLFKQLASVSPRMDTETNGRVHTNKQKATQKTQKSKALKKKGVDRNTVIFNNFMSKTIPEISGTANTVVDSARTQTTTTRMHTIVEINGIRLVFVCLNILGDEKRKHTTRASRVEPPHDRADREAILKLVYEIIDFKKTFNGKVFRSHTGTERLCVAQQLMADLDTVLIELRSRYEFNARSVAECAPQLFSGDSSFKKNGILAGQTYKLKDTQKQVLGHVADHFDMVRQNETDDRICTVILNRTAVGGGKTSDAVTLGSYIHALKRNSELKQDFRIVGTRLLYICNNESVRSSVSKYLLMASVSFGIATVVSDDTNQTMRYKISYNNRGNTTPPSVVICDPRCAVLILGGFDQVLPTAKKNSQRGGKVGIDEDIRVRSNEAERTQRYVVFFDEPTTGATEVSPLQREMNMLIINLVMSQKMRYGEASRDPCLILASGTLTDVSPIISTFNDHYTMNVHVVEGTDVGVSCQLETYEKATIYPHNAITCRDTMEKLFNASNFFRRFYTCRDVYALYEKILEAGVDDVPNPDTFFEANSCEKMNPTGVFEMVEKLLKSIPDDKIEHICSSDYASRTSERLKMSADVVDELFNTTQTNDTTIVATHDVITYTTTVLNDRYEHIGRTFSTRVRQRIEAVETYERMRSDINASKDGETTRERKLKDLDDEYEQKFDDSMLVPNELRVGNKRVIFNEIPQTVIDEMSKDAPEFIAYLMMGVGVYSTRARVLSHSYLSFVDLLASKERLSVIVCDETYVFGTNHKISQVIITESFEDNNTLDTIKQAAGRTARMHRSWTGKVVVSNSLASRLLRHIRQERTESIGGYVIDNTEETNIVRAFYDVRNKLVNLYNIERERERDKCQSEILYELTGKTKLTVHKPQHTARAETAEPVECVERVETKVNDESDRVVRIGECINQTRPTQSVQSFRSTHSIHSTHSMRFTDDKTRERRSYQPPPRGQVFSTQRRPYVFSDAKSERTVGERNIGERNIEGSWRRLG